ncbi:Alpha-xylosidase [compost metagenome]
MLGDSIAVAPVFTEAGDVQFYLPEGRWTHLWHNDEVQGSRWHKQQHNFQSLPVYVRENTLLALGNNSQKPDYAWNDGTQFQLFSLADGCTAISEVPAADGSVVFTLTASRAGNNVTFNAEGDARGWSICLRNVPRIGGVTGGSQAGSEWGVVVSAQRSEVVITL